MTISVATFNVENLFDRAKAFNEDDQAVTSSILGATAELNGLFEHGNYTAARKRRMIELMRELGLERSDRGPFVLLRRIRGRLVRRPRGGGNIEIVADGRDDWIGWVEAKSEPVNEVAIDNTGRVIRDVDADILAVIEADNRVALEMFSEEVIDRVGGTPYAHVMVIDGNDMRGIDVGLMTKADFPIVDMRSHIWDLNAQGNPVFSRDCPEYCIEVSADERIWVLPNHFKSKFGGNNAASRRRRRAQSARVAQIYDELIQSGEQNVIVLGDLNDTPQSAELAPLLAATDLADVATHARFDDGGFPGTFGLGNANDKIDYVLLSPALFDRIEDGHMFRRGAWPGVEPPRWDVYDELTRKVHVASDHHVVVVNLAS